MNTQHLNENKVLTQKAPQCTETIDTVQNKLRNTTEFSITKNCLTTPVY